MLGRQLASHVFRHGILKHSKQWNIRHRQFSSFTSKTAQAASPSSPLNPIDGAVAGIITELDRLGPRIDVQADQIQVLEGPKEFYGALKTKLRHAKRRIYLATLYVGKHETELIDCIRHALNEAPDLQVSIVTDALRGTREKPDPSCASLLSHLAAEYPQQVEIRMYHTPNLTGFLKSVVPKRINEGWGLQHMKLYGIDDEIILSGANLSNDYFTNRQDRYHVFKSRRVADYFAEVHQALCSVSFLLQPLSSNGSFTLSWPSSNPLASPLENPRAYNTASSSIFAPLLTPSSHPIPASSTNTSIYPLLIIPNALNNELPALRKLLLSPLPANSSFLFTAGYFNPHPEITSSLLAAAAATASKASTHSSAAVASGKVLTASPWANGFYGSKGVSGMLPPAYTLLARRFLKEVRRQASGAVELREWRLGTVGRPNGWTYHAKGLWLTLGGQLGVEKGQVGIGVDSSDRVKPQSQSEPLGRDEDKDTRGSSISRGRGGNSSKGPSVTVIGSSNYTVRSYTLDTEAGAVIVTRDGDLMRKLRREEENLLRFSKRIDEKDLEGGKRRVGWHVRVAMWIVTAVGGSL